ncbi:MAG: DsbA family protein [Pseudobdellovibrionaceae bacterium]
MKVFKAFLAVILLLGVGCASTDEKQLAELLKKNPQILYDVIEQNPAEFLTVLNRAAKKAQEQMYATQMSEQQKQLDAEMANPKKPVLNDSTRLFGSPTAKITVVEYADFQCPACRSGYLSLKELKKRRGSQIQFHYKHMPLDFHPEAMPASRYFEAIKMQDVKKAEAFYTYLFENQRQLTDEAFLKKAAGLAKADLKKLAVDIKSEQVQKRIDADMAEFQSFGYTGTPVVMINGVSMPGAQPAERLEQMIDRLNLTKQ